MRVLLLAVVDGPAGPRRGPRELRALELDGLELELAALLGLGHLVVEVLGRQRLLRLALALARQQPRLDGVPRDNIIILRLLPRRPARRVRVASRRAGDRYDARRANDAAGTAAVRGAQILGCRAGAPG